MIDDIINIQNEESEQYINSSSDDDEESHNLNDDESIDDNELDLDNYDDDFFAVPSSIELDYNSDQEIPETINKKILSDVSINSLIGFINIILKDINSNQFKEFSLTVYMTRKLLNIKKKSKTYAVCPKCDKLYNIADIMLNNSIYIGSGFKCTYIKFPNHPMQSHCKSCRAELLEKIPTVKNYAWRPKKIYTLPSLKKIAISHQNYEDEEYIRIYNDEK
ncbi:7530_t:CDS:2 [Funneliformis caledonium]|uniref:7530_t:CDS:1 n=1 Tax=Funneliformis caledonium TaxID=1117310 RepID=A0A9N9FIT7_9GLOM|nr:7530_t:CDS:2 [Funneliformis caledonium]